MMRYLRALADKDIALDRSMIPRFGFKNDEPATPPPRWSLFAWPA